MAGCGAAAVLKIHRAAHAWAWHVAERQLVHAPLSAENSSSGAQKFQHTRTSVPAAPFQPRRRRNSCLDPLKRTSSVPPLAGLQIGWGHTRVSRALCCMRFGSKVGMIGTARLARAHLAGAAAWKAWIPAFCDYKSPFLTHNLMSSGKEPNWPMPQSTTTRSPSRVVTRVTRWLVPCAFLPRALC